MDLSFLDQKLPQRRRPRRVVNIYDVLGQSGSELAADLTLAFFFDPDQLHGMNTAMLDALLNLLDGAPIMGDEGTVAQTLDARRYLGATGWSIDRQVSSGDAGRSAGGESRGEIDNDTDTDTDSADEALSWQGIIDLYLTNRDLDLAIVIENKIGAALNNPLRSYVRHALREGYSTVALVLLAPYAHSLTPDEARWVSHSITYDQLFDRLGEATEAAGESADLSRTRSIALLDQFREVRQRRGATVDYEREAGFVDEFAEALAGRGDAINAFFAKQQEINKIFRQRSERLRPLIDERLAQAGLATTWEAHGHGPRTGHWAYAWNAYLLAESNNSVELILCPDPLLAGPITAKAYPDRDYKYYPEFLHITLGVDWSSADEDIAAAFVDYCVRVAEAYPR